MKILEKSCLSFGGLLVLVSGCFGSLQKPWGLPDDSEGNEYKKTYMKENHSVMVHLVNWNFSAIAKECEEFLGPKGYGGVQISPVTEYNSLQGQPFWERYQPLSYVIQSPAGDEEAFQEMTIRCNAAGVRVYVDVVLNHMAYLENSSERLYPKMPFTGKDFNNECDMELESLPLYVRYCTLAGSPDLNQSSSRVKAEIEEFLNKLIDFGVAGFHIFAAKYMWPLELKSIYESLDDLNTDFGFPENSRPFIYQDVMDLRLVAVSKTEYSSFGAVSEYLYSLLLSDFMFGRKPLAGLENFGPELGFLPSNDAVVFLDGFHYEMLNEAKRSFDPKTQLEDYDFFSSEYSCEWLKAMTFMLLHPFGKVKRLVSLCRNKDDNCLHRRHELLLLLKVANSVNDQDPVTNFQEWSENQIVFCRGQKICVAFNNELEKIFSSEISVSLKEGVYFDIFTGSFHPDGSKWELGRFLKVNKDGKAWLTLPALQNDLGQSSCEGKGFNFAVFTPYLENSEHSRNSGNSRNSSHSLEEEDWSFEIHLANDSSLSSERVQETTSSTSTEFVFSKLETNHQDVLDEGEDAEDVEDESSKDFSKENIWDNLFPNSLDSEESVETTTIESTFNV